MGKSEPYPCGAQMWQKSGELLDFVRWCLLYRPGSRGDDRVLTYFVWRYWDGQDVHHGLTIGKIRLCTDEGTIRRRRQEIQEAEKKKKEAGLPFNERLLPSERVQRKREARAAACRNYYGCGQYALANYVDGEDE